MKRMRMSRRNSRRYFSKTAAWVHPINIRGYMMRGGYML